MAFTKTGIPAWLQPHKIHVGPPYTEYTIEKILTGLCSGATLLSLCEGDPTLPDYGQLLRYIHNDPKLLDQYYQAQKIGSEANLDRLEAYMNKQGLDGDGVPDDVAWIKTKIEHIRWLATKRNERYRDKREIDITTTIDISEAMKAAQERLESRRERLIEGEICGEG